MEKCVYCGYETDGIVSLEHSQGECTQMQKEQQTPTMKQERAENAEATPDDNNPQPDDINDHGAGW
jgi:hypothetical protein